MQNELLLMGDGEIIYGDEFIFQPFIIIGVGALFKRCHWTLIYRRPNSPSPVIYRHSRHTILFIDIFPVIHTSSG
jgi:hypothetical protein